MGVVTLEVLDGADKGRVFDDLPTPVTIGREEGNSIQLNDERVSRFHLKIQEDRDKIVLTDLESTNGTKVNGEDIQLRILRHGDLVALGRTMIRYGSREQIAERVAAIRRSDPHDSAKRDSDRDNDPPSLDRADRDRPDSPSNNFDPHATLAALQPPDLPERLSPAQAAQVSELLEYLHIHIRELLQSVKIKGPTERVSLEYEQWQNLLDLQSRLAGYLRAIGDPHAE